MCELNLYFRGSRGQFIAQLAQLFLEVNQRFTAKAFDLEQSLLPTLKTGENVPYSGHFRVREGGNCFGREIKFGQRAAQGSFGFSLGFQIRNVILPDLQTLVEAVHLTFAVQEASLLTRVEGMAI
jgi:hypothetical protein